jgi:hypothetical protein
VTKRLLFFLGKFVLLYGFVWVFFTFLGAPVYRHLLANGCEIYSRIEGKHLSFENKDTRILFLSYKNPQFEAQLDPEGIYANTVLLIALILATPGMRMGPRCQRLGIGLLLLFISHVLFLVTKVEVSLIEAGHPLSDGMAFWTFWDDFFEIVGRVFFPVAIWLLIGLSFMQGEVEKARVRTSGKLGRNQPCPCGSGKKHKHCCGPK